MLYKPNEGKIWDPTVVYWKGKYYAFTMFWAKPGEESLAMRLAVSDDGAHWTDMGCVLDGEGDPVYKMNIHMLKDGSFALNHGSSTQRSGYGNDLLIYYVSDDLIHWRRTGKNTPDPKWYEKEERWDHMAVIPSEEGGYIGYVVATPKKEIGGMIGIQRSDDGINWRECPPPKIDWDGCESVREMEVGGCEKIGDKWYLIGGICPPFEGNYAYSCYTFTAENENGPFRPDKEALRLCGFNGRQGDLFVQALAAFARNYTNDEKLVSNTVVYSHDGCFGDTWLLPLKLAKVDRGGHLRLHYYTKNDALKGKTVSKINEMTVKTTGFDGYMLDDHYEIEALGSFDPQKGAVIEGKMNIDPYPERGPVRAGCWRPTRFGFLLEEDGDLGEKCRDGNIKTGTAIFADCTLSKNRQTTIGNIDFTDINDVKYTPEDFIYPGCASPTGLDTGKEHTFRLLVRYGMFELYFDDLHIQSYTMKKMPSGKLYIALMNGICKLKDLIIYEGNF